MRKRWRLGLSVGVVAIVAFFLLAAMNANRPRELAYDFLKKAQLVDTQRETSQTGKGGLARTFEIEVDFQTYAANAEKELVADGWRLADKTDQSRLFFRDRTPNGDYQRCSLMIALGRPQVPGRSSEINHNTGNYLMVFIREGPRWKQGGLRGFLSRWFGI